MNYRLTEFTEDRYYVGLKYPGVISLSRLEETDLPSFWNNFADEFSSRHVSNLVPKEEAIGYMERKKSSDAELYGYLAACEVTKFGETSGFEKIVIPKGNYIFINICFTQKDEEIEYAFHYVQNELSSVFSVDLSFCFEYYPETFDHTEEDAILYLAFPIKE